MSEFQKVKGFQDIYGDDIAYWERAEACLRRCFNLYSIEEMRIPILEKTSVFTRGIGSTTDVVEKEMFTFEDRDGESLSLRPEGTAGVVRSYVENGLYNPPALKKYYYIGPMFRRERPQRGRYRQFTQGGVEYLGSPSALADAEVVSLLPFFFNQVGVGGFAHLEINSIGCPDCRPAYLEKLIEYFTPRLNEMCEDCGRRLGKNPLRVLDCKNEKCRTVIKDAPVMLDNLCSVCGEHFSDVKKNLTLLGVNYQINPLMVRGLDYYVRTAFEMVTDKLGAASAIGAGGRYDGLVKTLGGPDIGGVGFAIGMDRVVELMKLAEKLESSKPDVFIVSFESTKDISIKLLADMRNIGVRAELDLDGKGLKSQMKKADRSGARYAVILGEEEFSRGKLTLRNLADSQQEEIDIASLADILKKQR